MRRSHAVETVQLIVDEGPRIAVVAAQERFCQAIEYVGDLEFAARLRKQGGRPGALSQQADPACAMRIEHHKPQVSQFAIERRRLVGEVVMPAFVYAQPRRDHATVRPAIRTAIHPPHNLRSPALGAGYSSFTQQIYTNHAFRSVQFRPHSQ